MTNEEWMEKAEQPAVAQDPETGEETGQEEPSPQQDAEREPGEGEALPGEEELRRMAEVAARMTLMRQQQWEQAAGEYPAVWQAQDNLGEGYRALGMYDKALEAFERSFSMQGEKPFTDGLFARAQVHEQIGDYAAAMEDYRRIIDCLRDKWGITDGEEVDFELREIERLKELSARRA